MRLRRKKWGLPLGITLLIAVPLVLAVWLGQLMLAQPKSAIDILRTMAMYPGARNAEYTSSGGTALDPLDGASASVVYRANDIPESVDYFYENMLPSDGWTQETMYSTQFSFYKVEDFPNGFYVGGPPPWVRQRSRPIYCRAYITTLEKYQDGERFTEVKVNLMTMSAAMP